MQSECVHQSSDPSFASCLSTTESLLALRALPGFTDTKLRQLLKEDSSEILWEKFRRQDTYQQAEESAKKELDTCQNAGVSLIPFFSSHYPAPLKDLKDFPLILYVKGSWNPSPAVAIIGTRQCTIYGTCQATSFAEELAKRGVAIVSGLARGIDTAAHKGALAVGETFAVIGSGLGNLYPKENSALAEQISKKGALISELPYFTPPEKFQFPKRNRLVAALSHATLLVEAPIKSGAINTMLWAKGLGRPLFALPGRVDQETFQGNHHLIKNGTAKLAERPSDLFSSLPSLKNFQPNERKSETLKPEEVTLLTQMPSEEIGLDALILLTKQPLIQLNILLMSLVLKKRVLEFPGKIYKKV